MKKSFMIPLIVIGCLVLLALGMWTGVAYQAGKKPTDPVADKAKEQAEKVEKALRGKFDEWLEAVKKQPPVPAAPATVPVVEQTQPSASNKKPKEGASPGLRHDPAADLN